MLILFNVDNTRSESTFLCGRSILCGSVLSPCLAQKSLCGPYLVVSSLTPVFQFPALAGIAPAGLGRKAVTLDLARKAVKHDWHILHDTIKNEVPTCRLKSRKPYKREAQEM